MLHRTRPEWSHLAITARHILQDIITIFGATALSVNSAVIDSYGIKLWQVLPGPNYRVWSVVTAWATATDIAILHFQADRATFPDETITWKSPRLRVVAPPIGQQVVAFGYRDARVDVAQNSNAAYIQLNDRPTTSTGTIRQNYPSGRDSVMLPFPCFEIEARFDGGMSGGLVVDEAGSVCGLICSSFEPANSDELPISYAVSLWPMLKTVISVNRGGRYPPGSSYPVIDLALDGLLAVTDLGDVDPAEFPDKQLPRR